jgi:hypothetical protein
VFNLSYRNKTYVIFDGDKDMWAYAYMLGWKKNEHIEFDFHNAHDLKPLTDRASEATVKQRLRERFSTAKQVIVLIGESTKYLYKFVRWELEVAINLNLPIIVVNLNDNREYDVNRCPPILKDKYIVHVSFKRAIIKRALDSFPKEYASNHRTETGNRRYSDKVYKELNLL